MKSTQRSTAKALPPIAVPAQRQALEYLGQVEDYLSDLDDADSGRHLITLGMVRPLIEAMACEIIALRNNAEGRSGAWTR